MVTAVDHVYFTTTRPAALQQALDAASSEKSGASARRILKRADAAQLVGFNAINIINTMLKQKSTPARANLHEPEEATCMLLYLNSQTYLEDAGLTLAREVHAHDHRVYGSSCECSCRGCIL